MSPASKGSERLPTRRELAAAHKRLERRLRELVLHGGDLAEADHQRESAALKTALSIIERLLAARAVPTVARAAAKPRRRR